MLVFGITNRDNYMVNVNYNNKKDMTKKKEEPQRGDGRNVYPSSHRRPEGLFIEDDQVFS